ncbi:MAG: hypothetical protein EPN21_00240 [Methylococcaceae bacterium]|nr:MAG: hypothetical protein EPN21_00240 [Methylococcaceae bacterium]
MSQSTLLLYGLLELVVILLPLAAWWYWRLSKTERRLQEVWKAFDRFLKEHRRATLKDKAAANVSGGCLDILERLADEPPPGNLESWQVLWQELLHPPSVAAPLAVEPALAAEDPQTLKELQAVEDLLAQQNQQITALTDYKSNLLRVMQGKFSHIQDSNQELLSYVQRQMGDKSEMKGLRDVMVRLEENSGNIRGMLEGLEKEQAQPDPYLETLQRENSHLRAATARNIAQTRDLQEQKLLWQRKSSEVAKKLEQRNQAYNLLYRRYESLRHDYLRLIDTNISIPAEFPLE